MSSHFFIAGAQRSGTTYLHQILAEHPSIELDNAGYSTLPDGSQSWGPEPKFFLQEDAERRIDEYLNKYYTRSGASLRGEKSACYMEHPEVIARMFRGFPDARIIFILRDPVDRAISNYWYSVKNGLEDKSIELVLTDESYQERSYDEKRIVGCPPYNYLSRGKYASHIEKYLEFFDRRQIKILIFEDFVSDPMAVRDLFYFLNVDPDFVPTSINKKANPVNAKEMTHVSVNVENFLRQYYAESNALLADRFNVDISKWKSRLHVLNQLS